MVYVLTADPSDANKHARLVLANRSYLPANVQEIALSVPTLADLTALTGLAADPGSVVWVRSLHRLFVKDQTISILRPGQIVASSTTGVWRSVSGYTPLSAYWTSRTDWHIDPVAGDVENDGSSTHPIPSWAELMARLNNQQLGASVTVSVHGSLNESIDVRRMMPDLATGMTITGEPGATTVLAGTIGTWTPAVYPAGGEAILLTSAAAPDWTAYQGMRLRFTTGVASGALSAVSYVNPAGAGVGVTRVTAPAIPVNPLPSQKTPGVGDSFVVEALPSILGYIPPPALNGAPVIVRGFALPPNVSPARNDITGGMAWLWGCTCGDLQLTVLEANVQCCRFGTLAGSGFRVQAEHATVRNCTVYNLSISAALADMYYLLVQHGMSLGNGQYLGGYNASFDNPSGPGISMPYPGCSWKQDHNIYGKGNSTYGMLVGSGATWVYDALPTITGTTNDLSLGGAGFAWGGGPFVDLNKLCGVVPQ